MASIDTRGRAAAGGTVAAVIGSGGLLAGRIALMATTPRSEAVGNGSAAYARPALAVGPSLRLARGRWSADVHAGAVLALLVVRGEGHATNLTSTNVDPGLQAGLRVGLRLGPVTPSLEVIALGWLRRQDLTVAGSSASGDLPRFELLLGGGAAFGSM
jgi:hypothetical protein